MEQERSLVGRRQNPNSMPIREEEVSPRKGGYLNPAGVFVQGELKLAKDTKQSRYDQHPISNKMSPKQVSKRGTDSSLMQRSEAIVALRKQRHLRNLIKDRKPMSFTSEFNETLTSFGERFQQNRLEVLNDPSPATFSPNEYAHVTQLMLQPPSTSKQINTLSQTRRHFFQNTGEHPKTKRSHLATPLTLDFDYF